MEGKKTRGKQKREIRKIENERDLFITFTKRKSGINKKASELTTLCGAKVDILMFSPSGKSFCFGDPSLQSMTRTRLNEENPSEGGIYDKLVEDYKKLEIDQLNEKYDSLLDHVHAQKAREKELGGVLKTRDSCGWWEAKVQDLIRDDDQVMGMEVSLAEFQKNLMNELSIKGGENASHALAPIDQKSGVNLYPTNASGSNISEVVFGANNEAYGVGATENTDLPNFSATPTNEVEAFNLIPYDGRRGDLFDIVFPPNNQARGDSLFYLDDPNGSGKSATSSLPTDHAQTPELHLTDASGSGCHATDL